MVTAIVTGTGGQDGYFLVQRLLGEGATVHACHNPANDPPTWDTAAGTLSVHALDVTSADAVRELVRGARPDEIYNFAAQSSVSRSFADPALTWQVNAAAVASMLETVRCHAPEARYYQASSTDIFGFLPGESVTHNENSALFPQSPYAAAKAAAFLLCRVYRQGYGIRAVSGISSNHESHRRPGDFLSAKIARHVAALRAAGPAGRDTVPPLELGNLKSRRDWGYAPDFALGALRILRQVPVRGELSGEPEDDIAANYRDYILGTGVMHSAWELADSAFRLGGFELDWRLGGADQARWGASFRDSGRRAIVVNPDLMRPTDPLAIGTDPSRAIDELGWSPTRGLERFLREMIESRDG
ncbi:MAG: GDP-mannose 4,6-dehydratase [Dehalococcoidia bacterium]